MVRFGAQEFGSDESLPFSKMRPPSDLHSIEVGFDMKDVPAFLPCAVYAAHVLRGLRFREYKVLEDLLFLNDVMMRVMRYANAQGRLYGYRLHSGSTCHTRMTFDKARDRIYAWRDILQTCEAKKGRAGKSFVRHYCNQLTEFAVYGATLGKVSEYAPDRAGELWRIWREALRDIVGLRVVSALQRWRIRIYLMCPHECWAKLLFAVPFRLKMLRNKARGWIKRSKNFEKN